MALSNKGFRRIRNLLFYGIAFIFCLFLILLTNRVVWDLDQLSNEPQLKDFEKETMGSQLLEQKDSIQSLFNQVAQQTELDRNALEAATKLNRVEKESYNSWLKTRQVIGSPDQDQEVLARTQKLDSLFQIQQNWEQQVSNGQRQALEYQDQLNALNQTIDQERSNARTSFNQAYRAFELRTFLLRLLIVFPILGLGIFFLLRYRNHRLWPLFLGYILFSFYTFFFGLIPYLPWYGGYVRYTVGILLSIFLGGYAIRAFRKFAERQETINAKTQENLPTINRETAEKAYEKHHCPSCGKDFMPKKWELTSQSETGLKVRPQFCRHCGQTLFKACNNCQTVGFAHFPFCGTCGHAMHAPEEVSNP